MRELQTAEINAVAGAYSDNIFANIVEGIVCSIGGAVIGAWTFATLGGSGATSSDLIGIGGGLTALIGMIGGAVVGAVAGAIYGPYVGYDDGLVLAESLIKNLMQGLPGATA